MRGATSMCFWFFCYHIATRLVECTWPNVIIDSFFFSHSYCRSNHDFLGITLFICNLIKLVITKNKNPKLNLVRCLCWLLCRLDHASTSLPFFFFFFPFDYNLKWCLIFSIFLGVGLMVCGVFLDVSSFRIMPDFCLWGYA